jgi:hypothetical protein
MVYLRIIKKPQNERNKKGNGAYNKTPVID